MPRASTLILLLTAVLLAALGFAGAAPAAVFLALALEFAAWKRAADSLRAARVARPRRAYRR
jgi:hypothetical protein